MQILKPLTLIALILGVLVLSGCKQPRLPPATALAQGMASVMIDTGFYKEVSITKTIGNHYNPSTEVWTVFACYQSITQDDTQGSNCVDSFTVLSLDNGSWVVTVTIQGVYRWRAINFAQTNPAVAEQSGNAPAQTPGVNK